jgi:hypothetical protein
MSESVDFWEGYNLGLKLLGTELDKILSKCYNDRRTQNDLLDVKVYLNSLKEMKPNVEETLADRLFGSMPGTGELA